MHDGSADFRSLIDSVTGWPVSNLVPSEVGELQSAICSGTEGALDTLSNTE